jgi:glycosyltransferase involved in cell wall biosynthesis
MRFSVLLPTRNGAAYLDDVIASVLNQPYQDMELVVSDNASGPETRAVVSKFFGDKRLTYVRLDQVVSVTDNWNHAFRASHGDYVVMIGDDDCLLPHFFDTLDAAIDRHGHPDCITYNGLTFVFPRCFKDQPSAFFVNRHFAFGPDFVPDGLLLPDFRRQLVRDMFAFKVRFPLNMQLTLFAREAAARIRGGVFRAPFPDHYALNSLLLVAQRFVFIPDRLVTVGVSPKSFGHYYYGGEQRAGAAYLGLSTPAADRLPGSELLNCMRDWLVLLKSEYPDDLASVSPNQWSYAGRQTYHWMRDFEFGLVDTRELMRRVRLLSWGERSSFVLPLFAYRGVLRMLRAVGLRQTDRVHDMWPALRPLPGVDSIQQFVQWATAHDLS